MRNPKGIQSECLPIDPVLVWYSHSLSCIPGGWVNPCSRGGNGQACKALQGQAPVAVSGLRLLGAERCEHAGEAWQATKSIGALRRFRSRWVAVTSGNASEGPRSRSVRLVAPESIVCRGVSGRSCRTALRAK
jgi:hypothetical protein